jgi:hypothetical protein
VSSRCKQTTPSLWPKPKPDRFRASSAQSPSAIGIHSGPQLLQGLCWVGDRWSGSPRPRQCPERGTRRATPATMNGDAGRATRTRSTHPRHAMQHHSRNRISVMRSGSTTPAGPPQCLREARPRTGIDGVRGKPSPRPGSRGALQEASPLAKVRRGTGAREAGGIPPRRGRKTTAVRPGACTEALGPCGGTTEVLP